MTSTVIRRGDTLWSLAEKMRPGRDVTIEQTIVALVNSNPQAFPTGNANVMAAGATLRLPPRDVLTAQAHADAVRQLSIMERAWMSAGASRSAQARASSGADDAAPATSTEDAGALARQTEMAVQAAEAAQQAAASSSGAPSGQGTRLTLLTDTQTQADIDRLLAGGGEGMQVQVAPSVLNAVLEGGASEEVVRARRLERLEELEQKWQENQRVLSAIRAERDALRDEVVNLRDQITQLRIQVERLVAHQENQGLMPALSNMYEGALERPLVLGGSALAALLFLLALVRRRPRESDSLKREAVGVQAPAAPPRAPARPDPEQARTYSRGEDLHSTMGTSAAAPAGEASSNNKPHGAVSAEAASDDFEARVQQLSAAASADEADAPRTAVFEVPESPEQEPAPADARTEASEDAAAGKPAVIDYQPVKADASGVTRAASDEDAAPHNQEAVDYQAPAFDHQASIDYQAPSLEKTQAHAADAADKSESLEQPVVNFAPRSAPDDAGQARAVDAAFDEPSAFYQSALPEGFKVEVVEYPLHDSSSAAPADENKTLEKDC
ncbi:MAG TPA: FimV/HubP family polar landmark protein [Halomonas sp.]|nr:FimV/HubP family polar landmark protein [Halomonas sp.]